MSTRWRSLSERTRRELDALQCGRTEGVKLVPMPSMGREPQDRRFSVILSADLGDVGARTSRARRARREHTIWVELELFLQPDFPNTPPYLHCHSKDIEHWSMDRSGRIDIGRLIEWSPRIELTSLLSHVRQNLISEMALSPEKARRPARSASPRGGVVTPVLAGAMSGEWRALGYSDGTDTKRKGLQEELEEFTLDVRPDGYVSGYPTYELDNPADVFNLSGTVKNDSRGQLRLQMQQIYSTTNNVTKWSAKVGSDGTTLHGGEWSGSCAGTFKAERVTTPSPAPAPRSARPVYRAPQPEPEPEPQPQPQPEPEPEPQFAPSPSTARRQKMAEEREKTLWELAKSEDQYGKELELLKAYRRELKKMVPRADSSSLFQALDEIAALHASFDHELNETLGSYHDGNAALAERYGGICSVLINMIPQMKCYKGYVESLTASASKKLLAQARVVDTIAKVATANPGQPGFDVLRMKPARRLESYKACFRKLLEHTSHSAPEYKNLCDINDSLDTLLTWEISPKKPARKKKPTAGPGAGDDRPGFTRTATAGPEEAEKVRQAHELKERRQAQRERAEAADRAANGAPPSYNPEPTAGVRGGGGATNLDGITAARERERALIHRAQQVVADEARVQRQQELELKLVVEEVVKWGYDRELVEKVQIKEQHSSPIELSRAVESESPKVPQAKLPRFVGIANPSSYCFANATIQCLRHTPRLIEDLTEITSPTRGGGGSGRGARPPVPPPESLIEAFVLLLERMDRNYGGHGVEDHDRARQEFMQLCAELLPSQPGADTDDWYWYWGDDEGGFSEYDADTAEVIERAYQLGHQSVTVTIESRRGGQYSRPAEYTIENLQGRGDGVRWQTNAATRVERVVERRARSVSAPPSRIVEVDWRQQRQQDAGEFLHLLLDQFAVDTRSDGSAVLGRTLTKPQMAINRGVTDTLVKRLTTAARQKRTVEENAMLKEFADEQWDSTGNAARRTAIGKFFQGQTLQLKKCHHCGEYSPCTADPFLIEQLHLKPLAERPRGSLEELLEAASAPELPKDYRCHGCRKLGTTAIMTGLVRLPRVFVVRLDRAHRTSFGAESRISTPIDYPDHLNLAGTGAHL
jgi:hypothetical protein